MDLLGLEAEPNNASGLKCGWVFAYAFVYHTVSLLGLRWNCEHEGMYLYSTCIQVRSIMQAASAESMVLVCRHGLGIGQANIPS